MSTLNNIKDTPICFVLGAPGAGKGTLCARLAEDFPIYHFSVGDHLRALSSSGGPLTLIDNVDLNSYLQNRRLLPPVTIVELLAQKLLSEQLQRFELILIDGFPRTAASAALFDQMLVRPSLVLLFDCAEDVARSRFLNRARGDDNAGVFAQRWAEMQTNSPGINERYKNLIKVIDTVGSVDATYQRLCTFVSRFLENTRSAPYTAIQRIEHLDLKRGIENQD